MSARSQPAGNASPSTVPEIERVRELDEARRKLWVELHESLSELTSTHPTIQTVDFSGAAQSGSKPGGNPRVSPRSGPIRPGHSSSPQLPTATPKPGSMEASSADAMRSSQSVAVSAGEIPREREPSRSFLEGDDASMHDPDSGSTEDWSANPAPAPAAAARAAPPSRPPRAHHSAMDTLAAIATAQLGGGSTRKRQRPARAVSSPTPPAPAALRQSGGPYASAGAGTARRAQPSASSTVSDDDDGSPASAARSLASGRPRRRRRAPAPRSADAGDLAASAAPANRRRRGSESSYSGSGSASRSGSVSGSGSGSALSDAESADSGGAQRPAGQRKRARTGRLSRSSTGRDAGHQPADDAAPTGPGGAAEPARAVSLDSNAPDDIAALLASAGLPSRITSPVGALASQLWSRSLRQRRKGGARRTALPQNAVVVLRAFLFERFLHPYPSEEEKHRLATATALTVSQVANWFINARVRIWRPVITQLHTMLKAGELEGPVARELVAATSKVSAPAAAPAPARSRTAASSPASPGSASRSARHNQSAVSPHGRRPMAAPATVDGARRGVGGRGTPSSSTVPSRSHRLPPPRFDAPATQAGASDGADAAAAFPSRAQLERELAEARASAAAAQHAAAVHRMTVMMRVQALAAHHQQQQQRQQQQQQRGGEPLRQPHLDQDTRRAPSEHDADRSDGGSSVAGGGAPFTGMVYGGPAAPDLAYYNQFMAHMMHAQYGGMPQYFAQGMTGPSGHGEASSSAPQPRGRDH